MKRRVVVCLLLCVPLSFSADKKRKGPKPPEIEVLEATVRRSEGVITLDGRVKNAGERPAQGLVLVFDFAATGKQVVTSKRGPAEDADLAPEAETEFHVQINDPVRAVEVSIQAVDGSGRELNVIKPGPYAIE